MAARQDDDTLQALVSPWQLVVRAANMLTPVQHFALAGLACIQHSITLQCSENLLWAFPGLPKDQLVLWTQKFERVKDHRSHNVWNALETHVGELLCVRLTHLYPKLDTTAADILDRLDERTSSGLGLVHLLVVTEYIKLGRTEAFRTDFFRKPQALTRLRSYVVQANTENTSLVYAPIIYVTSSAQQASVLEKFAHLHMFFYNPKRRLSSPTDKASEVGKEKYKREAVDELLHLLHWPSQLNIDKIVSGHQVCRGPFSGRKQYGTPLIQTMEEFNLSLSL